MNGETPAIAATSARPQRMLTFRGGGWVLLLAALIGLGIVAYVATHTIQRSAHRPPGDGRHVESYLFDLSTCLVPRDRLIPGLSFRDLAPPMTDPVVLTGSELAAINEKGRDKYLVSTDRVIGVSLNGQSRAYPVTVLGVHQIVNDTLGGVPIVVTYDPLCDSAAVFDRRPLASTGETPGEPLQFGVSGLLYNSNLLLYDRRRDATSDGAAAVGGESLWCQLQAKAIAGPAAAAGRTLLVLPLDLTSWSDWQQRHPDTTVMQRDPTMLVRYQDTTLARELRLEKLRYPVDPPPTPAPAGLPVKARVAVVLVNGSQRVYSLADLANRADETLTIHDEIAGVPLRLICKPVGDELTVVVQTNDDKPNHIGVMYACWFAWHAMHPETQITR